MDLGKDKISGLFIKLLLPTIAGMIFSSIFVVVDGIMVGKGIGSEGLAGVNLISPLFTLSTGLGLMFGMGGSVLASEALGSGCIKQARTYTFFTLKLAMISSLLSLTFLLIFADETLSLLGVPEDLSDKASQYYYPLIPAIFFNVLMTAGLFFIRLDGAPSFAMICVAISSIGNIFLDWLFIFPFGMGMFGAAIATTLSQVAGFGIMAYYIVRRARIFRFRAMNAQIPKVKDFSLAGRIMSIGFPAFLGDLSISFMVILGNFVFNKYVGIDGIAAFSVVCFIYPIVFMAYNAVVQSVQPIISYNYRQYLRRACKALSLSLLAIAVCGIVFSGIAWFGSENLVSLFLEKGTTAWELAAKRGVSLFGVGFLFFGMNILLIGYMQSIGIVKQAIFLTVLRGGIFTAAAFVLLPFIWGCDGIWLAVPVAEIMSFVCISTYMVTKTNLYMFLKK